MEKVTVNLELKRRNVEIFKVVTVILELKQRNGNLMKELGEYLEIKAGWRVQEF